jgi:hypothetical protein
MVTGEGLGTREKYWRTARKYQYRTNRYTKADPYVITVYKNEKFLVKVFAKSWSPALRKISFTNTKIT